MRPSKKRSIAATMEVYKIGIRWSFLKPILIDMVEAPEHLKPKDE